MDESFSGWAVLYIFQKSLRCWRKLMVPFNGHESSKWERVFLIYFCVLIYRYKFETEQKINKKNYWAFTKCVSFIDSLYRNVSSEMGRLSMDGE